MKCGRKKNTVLEKNFWWKKKNTVPGEFDLTNCSVGGKAIFGAGKVDFG